MSQSLPELPPLPEMDGPDVGYYVGETLEQYARSYGNAVWEAAIEEAAQEVESFRSNDKAANLTAHEIIRSELAEEIASAIRSLKAMEGKNNG